MNKKLLFFYFVFIVLPSFSFFGQDIALYKQFNGRYDFTFIGNTLNLRENGIGIPCAILTTSSATLTLNSDDQIEKAYLYWAGSGPGDFKVKLNNQDIIAERTFNVVQNNTELIFFSAFKDITAFVQTTGNGLYTFSDLDLTNIIADYCPNGTNFGGWSIIIIYKNDNLPLNQLNLYDGLQYVPDAINITLTNLNVIDDQDAKIGFLAWEGDRNISVNETLRINGNIISNPPLNPANNAFNGTNSFTGSDQLFNMDMDFYSIQDNIAIGDDSAEISLTSGQDFVMINTILTKLNSQLPDATIALTDYTLDCRIKKIDIEFSVYNIESTNPLPAGTPIAIYINNQLVSTLATQTIIPIDGSENFATTLTIPENIVANFQLKLVVDDTGNGTGIVTEINETNNTFITTIALLFPPKFNPLEEIKTCNLGLGRGIFNFSYYEQFVKVNTEDQVSFFNSHEDAIQNVNAINNTTNYITQSSPTEIFVRIEDVNCFSITSFLLSTKNCPPKVYNGFSPNHDGMNDFFFIDGLRNIFTNYELFIYSRWGTLVWQGNHNDPDWDGTANKGATVHGNLVPESTYYYVLELNDPDYPKALVGWLYLTR